MSSTRHAPEGAPLRAERWASNPAIERGLPANAVRLRCKVLDSAEDRDLVWATHRLSWEIGLRQIAADLLRDYCEHLGTETMIRLGREEGRIYTAEEVRRIRPDGFEERWNHFFPLKGEGSGRLRTELMDFYDDEDLAEENRKAESHPECYPARAFVARCAARAGQHLVRDLTEWCLNPEINLRGWPWYWASLTATLRAYVGDWIAQRRTGVVVTAIGARVQEALDFTLRGQKLQGACLTLLIGDGRTGKTHAARQWCEARPGKARFIEIPAGNDDKSFYQALARGLGLGELTNLKANELKPRIEQVLLTGDLLLCLDQCQRAWPQNLFRPGFPCRIDWLISMSDKGVPICCIGTEQFNKSLLACGERSGWDTNLWTDRANYVALLPTLAREDLAKVARVMLPGADTGAIDAAAIYAGATGKALGAIETIARHAKCLADQAGRSEPSAADVRAAMKDFTIPSHLSAADAYQKPMPGSRRGRQASPARDASDLQEAAADFELPADRGQAADGPRSPRGAGAKEDFHGANGPITGRSIRPLELAADSEAEVTAG